MNHPLNYKVIEIVINGHPTFQTLGLNDLLGVELSIQPIIPEALTRGLIEQVAHHLLTISEYPSLFNDPWIQYAFRENKSLCLIPFVLLESEGICHIIIADFEGHYPWQLGCLPPFNHQVNEALLLSNLLAVIKSFFLTHLILDVALDVYMQIGISIDITSNLQMNELPDYLAQINLDMFIALTLCFNTTMPHINHFVLSACESIPLILTDMVDPISQASEIASRIYQLSMKEQYVTMIMQAFHKLTQS